jgi:hypothetical protein
MFPLGFTGTLGQSGELLAIRELAPNGEPGESFVVLDGLGFHEDAEFREFLDF